MSGKTVTFKSTWSVRLAKPLVTRKQLDKITRKATISEKFRLLTKKSHYSFDDGCIIRYKQMGDTIYVMRRGTKT